MMDQIIYSGYNSYKKLKFVLDKHEPQKIFLVSEKNAFKLSGADELLSDTLRRYNVIQFFNFELNPKIYDILKGVRFFNDSQCDFIIGIGGGSVMDMAKGISILIENQDGNIEKLIKNNSPLNKRKISSMMIPTTAGTGSESTHFAVVYINKIKYSIEHESIISDYVILDPTFTENLPPYITACTGMDALCQAIESFWSVNSTEESRVYSEKAIEFVLPNIVKVVNNPDRNLRKSMLLGSNFAGKAINIAKTTAAHSVSYPLTSYFNIPHGHAVALTLPFFIEFNYEVNPSNLLDRRGIKFVRVIMNKLFKILKVKTATEARKKIIEIMNEIKMKTCFSDFAIYNDFEMIIKNGLDSKRIGNNPRLITKSDLSNLLEKIK